MCNLDQFINKGHINQSNLQNNLYHILHINQHPLGHKFRNLALGVHTTCYCSLECTRGLNHIHHRIYHFSKQDIQHGQQYSWHKMFHSSTFHQCTFCILFWFLSHKIYSLQDTKYMRGRSQNRKLLRIWYIPCHRIQGNEKFKSSKQCKSQ